MNLKNVTDQNLMIGAEHLVREERELLSRFLHHLKEIDRRRLFSSFGYKSLFEMTVKHFGYSEDEAYRRISAMKLLKEIPEVEEKINQGEITLTHLSLAQKHFRKETKTKEEKIQVLDLISNTSVRETEKIMNPIKQNEIRIVVTPEMEEKLEKLKGLLAQKCANQTELFDLLLDLGLKEHTPVAPQKRCVTKSKAQVRREVFLKANNKCENCGSTHALQIDHIQPKAFGGSDNPENLRLLCRSCNQRAAIIAFGAEKLEQYLS